ncbi:HAMP domain-containing sensor histidine kinase [Occultella gossypii]|uniref:Signal transduction histidine-protein kinase/phosphatase MprB n=1 Tax=Occultella gossypii TaxID=2800820 RepID=A0ABS7SAL7_9MICO|nr:HAMP domain-containing sensor histidine kinase [Occultella gossypii]MBZ2196331.1 HAMP domain-containing histidine kinase [Occultella gossypii]
MSTPHVRHARSTELSWWRRTLALVGDLRPLDPMRSIKMKLIVIIAATVAMYTLVTWAGIRFGFGVLNTFPFALGASLILTQILARGMTRPLREMTAAARSMARGDYSTRVHTNSQDEVGELAAAFNSMAQDLDTLDAQRREMVANVSHELRTPVAALRAQLENMADGVVEPDPDALEGALTQIERLSRLITYLLDLSRLEAGAASLALTEFEVQEFLDDVATQARHAAAGFGRDLRWEVSTLPPDLHLTADEERLRQVISNLLGNASRHSPRGGTVSLRGRYSATTDEVVIEVLDEGQGIPVSDREKVFERFERGNAPAQRGGLSTGGTGLGLAIARWAVSLHGGMIAVADPPGGTGAMLRVTLPARGPAEGRAHPATPGT